MQIFNEAVCNSLISIFEQTGHNFKLGKQGMEHNDQHAL